MIATFADKPTEDLFHGRPTRHARRFPPDIVSAALRKLDSINAARSLSDLKAPPGNRLEALQGTRRGYQSIRVNDRWRIVFRWCGGDAHEVHVVDYHGRSNT